METLLVAAAIADKVLPPLAHIYFDKGVELAAATKPRARSWPDQTASEEDWYTEYLAPILAVRCGERHRPGDGAHSPNTARRTPTPSSRRTG